MELEVGQFRSGPISEEFRGGRFRSESIPGVGQFWMGRFPEWVNFRGGPIYGAGQFFGVGRFSVWANSGVGQFSGLSMLDGSIFRSGQFAGWVNSGGVDFFGAG